MSSPPTTPRSSRKRTSGCSVQNELRIIELLVAAVSISARSSWSNWPSPRKGWSLSHRGEPAGCRSHADGLRALTGLDPALRQVMAADNGIAHFEQKLRQIARHAVLNGETGEMDKLLAAADVGFLGLLTNATVGWNRAKNALAITHADRLDEAR